jgi:hypothetical protein
MVLRVKKEEATRLWIAWNVLTTQKAVLEILTSGTDRISRLRGVGDGMVLGIGRREREVIVDLKTLNRGFLALVKF